MFYVHTCKSVYCPQSWWNIPQRLHRLLFTHTHTHTKVKRTFSHRQFCYNTVYFSMFDTVVYMYCPATRPCGVGGVPLDFWVITGETPTPLSFSLLSPCVFEEWQSVTFLIGLKLPRGGGKTRRLLGLITSTFLTILCAVIWILTLSCWDDTCVQFLLTHMYIKRIYVYPRAIHKQSITVTNTANSCFVFFQLLF